MDHETFGIKWYPEEGRAQDFCKTNRKPYDVLVCVALLAMDHSFNDPKVFNFSSDGDNEEWETAKFIFEQIVGISIGNIFPEESHLEVA